MGKSYTLPAANITKSTVLDGSPSTFSRDRRAQAEPRPKATRGAGGAPTCRVTVLVPAYNEAESLADTIKSLQTQTQPPEEIIVIDDCSTDDTAEVARACGATVIRPPVNTGSKAGAQTFAIPWIRTEFVMAIDADTTLAPDAIETLCPAFDDPDVAAACGFVLPRFVQTVWERGRYVEYLLAFSWYKPIQDYYEKPLISSGCFSMYRTNALKVVGGWSGRTLAEDMDLTWTFYQRGYRVRFVPDAVCYPIEPHTFTFMRKQLKRWSHGFIQNVRLHWRALLDVPFLRTAVAVGLWDATIASLAYLVLLPVLALAFGSPLLLLGYVIDVPMILVPALTKAARRKECGKVLASIPAFFVLRLVNGLFFLEAVWSEWVLRRSFRTYEKGH
jgi:cellulose synthase/poly-beta-1,6-N-acetylglucosamine synthase-like glycosyltransferase